MTLLLSMSDTNRECDLCVPIRPLSTLKALFQTKVALSYPPNVRSLFLGNGRHQLYHWIGTSVLPPQSSTEENEGNTTYGSMIKLIG